MSFVSSMTASSGKWSTTFAYKACQQSKLILVFKLFRHELYALLKGVIPISFDNFKITSM